MPDTSLTHHDPGYLPATDDPFAYDTLRRRFVAQVRPRDIVEEVLVGDVVELVWEAVRLRRMRALELESLAYLGVADVVAPHFGELGVHGLSERWARRQPTAVREVDEILAAAGLAMEHVAARTFALHMSEMERIERLIAAAEARRNAALREIERHRAALARDLRAAADIEDVPAEDVPVDLAADLG